MLEESEDVSASVFSSGVSDAASFSFFSRLGKSNPAPLPGVLGVLVEPKDAKAPVPRPKADEAFAEGDFVVEGEMALNGFVFPPWDEVSPNLRLVYDRGESTLLPSFPSWSFIDSESLLVLCV